MIVSSKVLKVSSTDQCVQHYYQTVAVKLRFSMQRIPLKVCALSARYPSSPLLENDTRVSNKDAIPTRRYLAGATPAVMDLGRHLPPLSCRLLPSFLRIRKGKLPLRGKLRYVSMSIQHPQSVDVLHSVSPALILQNQDDFDKIDVFPALTPSAVAYGRDTVPVTGSAPPASSSVVGSDDAKIPPIVQRDKAKSIAVSKTFFYLRLSYTKAQNSVEEILI